MVLGSTCASFSSDMHELQPSGCERQGPDQEQLCLAVWKQKTGSVSTPHLVHPLMLQLTHQKIWHGSQDKQEGSQQRRFRKEPHWVLAFRRQGRCAREVEVTSTQLSSRTWNQTKVNWCPAQGSLLIPQQTKLSQNFNQLQENPCHSDLNKSEICLLTVTRSRCQGAGLTSGNAIRDPASSPFLLCHPLYGPWTQLPEFKSCHYHLTMKT